MFSELHGIVFGGVSPRKYNDKSQPAEMRLMEQMPDFGKEEILERLDLFQSGYQIMVSDTIASLKEYWLSGKQSSIFLQPEFLQILEGSGPRHIRYQYGMIFKANQCCACFCLELMDFDAEERLNFHHHEENPSYLDQIALACKKFLARRVHMRVAIMGSLLGAGPFGIQFAESLSKFERERLIYYITRFVFESSRIQAELIILKDFPATDRLQGICTYKFPSFYEFTIQPTMLFRPDPEWKSLDDYLNALQSKYRVKCKKVIKSGQDLQFESLNVEEMKFHQKEIYALYREVALGAGFNMVELNENYFFELKSGLKERFEFVVVKWKDSIVGFYSLLKDGTILQAHFLGYSRKLNKQMELYHNILLHIVEKGIKGNFSEINFARTALEIKSSIGAVPEDLYCYIAHQSKLINKVVPHILEFLKPKLEWTARSPFR